MKLTTRKLESCSILQCSPRDGSLNHVDTNYQRVTDSRTDGQTDGFTIKALLVGLQSSASQAMLSLSKLLGTFHNNFFLSLQVTDS